MLANKIFSKLKENRRDQEAFAKWYQYAYPIFYHYAFRLTSGNPELSEELCQETIINFITGDSLNQIDDSQHANAYIKVMLRNLYLNKIRQQRHHKNQLHEHAQSDNSASAFDTIVANEELDLIVNSLKPEDREILWMMMSGESLSDIAEICGLTYSATGTRVHRIRSIIKHLEKTR